MHTDKWERQVIDHLEDRAEQLRAKKQRDGGKLSEDDGIRLQVIERLLARFTQEAKAPTPSHTRH
jgi:hypothetical protein